MNKIMKRVLAGVASAALALTGLVGGAATASAAEPTVVTGDQTLTFKATEEQQLTNATLKAYKIADYLAYGSGTSVQYGLQTTAGAKNAITAVIQSIDKPGTDPAEKYQVPAGADPLAWAQSQDIFGSEEGGTSTSNERQLANGLKALATASGTLLTLSATAQNTDGTYQRTATVPAGLYVIVDTSTTNPSVPMIVGTAPYKNADGTVDMKNGQTPTGVTKVIDGSHSASADLGQKKTVTLTVTMPQTANYDTYAYDIYDLADPGMTIDTSTIRVAGKKASEGSTGSTVINYTVKSTSRSDHDVTPSDNDPEVSGNFVGSSSKALRISFTLDQLKKLGITAGHSITVTYEAWLTAGALDNDASGNALAEGATSSTHAVMNKVLVSANGTESAIGNDQKALLATSDFSFSKVWADNSKAEGAKFTVSKTVTGTDGTQTTEYLQAQDKTTKAWSWGTTKHEFDAATDGNIFTFQGLADGEYTVTESTSPTGANPDLKPSFTVTITHGNATPAVATSNDPWGLVRTQTTTGSNLVAVVTNVRSITELPKTGAAGIILAVAVAILLFAGAFLLVSIYRRKAAARR